MYGKPAPRAAKLWTATYLLMGLSFEEPLISQSLEGVQNMRESTTYQAILREGREVGWIEGREEGREEGRIGEAQRMLLMLAETRFGEPNETIRGVIEAIPDVERLERMTKQVLAPDLHDWEGLLSTP